MCAIVPCTSLVVTDPVIVPSSATRKLPAPEPGTLSGGTSSAPDITSIAPLPGIQSGSEEQAESASAALARSSFAISLFIVILPDKWQHAGG